MDKLVAVFLSLLLFVAPAWAQQGQKLSQLPLAATPLTGSELIYVVQNGASAQTTANSIVALFSASGDLSLATVKPTGATTALTLANIAANTLLPAAYGAPANTHYSLINGSYVAATAGSSIITAYSNTFTAADIGKNIVISGLGPDVTQSAAVSAGGSGNAVGDVLTLSMPGCTTAAQLTVTAVASGGVTAAMPTTNGSCAPASIPTNPVSVASTTGSGTGATFTLTYGAYSLATTIAGVTSATQITLAANSAQTVGHFETIAYGSDDSVAINAALASGRTSLTLDPGKTYGITSPILFSTTNRIKFDCNGATIAALGPMAEMMYEAQPSNFNATQGSILENCRLDGMGQATLIFSDNAFSWTHQNNYEYNAAPGGGDFYTGGSAENTFSYGNHYDNEYSVSGAGPAYCVSDNYTNNQFTDEIGSGCNNGFVENSAGVYLTAIHMYGNLGSSFVINGNSEYLTGLFADGVPSYVAGIQLNGGFAFLQGWDALGVVGNTGAIGVSIANATGYDDVYGGFFTNVTNANAVVPKYASSAATNNQVLMNTGASYNYLALPLGTLQTDFDTYPPHAGYVAEGSSGSPITTNGATFAITRYENMPVGSCGGNPNNTECNPALNIIVYGGSTDNVNLDGLNITAVASTTVAGVNSNAMTIRSYLTGSGVNVAQAAYILGERQTSTGSSQAFEASTWNATSVSCYVSYTSIGSCDDGWFSARGSFLANPESSAVHIGQGNTTGVFTEGVTINNGSVTNIGFNDQSSATNSFEDSGTHGATLIAYNATLTNFADASTSTISGSLLKGPNSNLTAAGVLLLGTNTAPALGTLVPGTQFQSFSTTDYIAGHIMWQATNDNTAANIDSVKSRGTTIGSEVAVQASDSLGIYNFRGTDGTNPVIAAAVQAIVMPGATVSTGIVPGELQFRTANASGVNTLWLVGDDTQSGFVGSSGSTKLFDATGNLFGNSFVAQGTSPTGTTGSCVASSFVGGAVAGKFSAAVCTAGTFILSALPAAPHGYACDALDQTTPADTLKQSANTTTSVTFTATTVASDSVVFKCLAY